MSPEPGGGAASDALTGRLPCHETGSASGCVTAGDGHTPKPNPSPPPDARVFESVAAGPPPGTGRPTRPIRVPRDQAVVLSHICWANTPTPPTPPPPPPPGFSTDGCGPHRIRGPAAAPGGTPHQLLTAGQKRRRQSVSRCPLRTSSPTCPSLSSRVLSEMHCTTRRGVVQGVGARRVGSVRRVVQCRTRRRGPTRRGCTTRRTVSYKVSYSTDTVRHSTT